MAGALGSLEARDSEARDRSHMQDPASLPSESISMATLRRLRRLARAAHGERWADDLVQDAALAYARLRHAGVAVRNVEAFLACCVQRSSASLVRKLTMQRSVERDWPQPEVDEPPAVREAFYVIVDHERTISVLRRVLPEPYRSWLDELTSCDPVDGLAQDGGFCSSTRRKRRSRLLALLLDLLGRKSVEELGHEVSVQATLPLATGVGASTHPIPSHPGFY